jgi:hypothetical protein
MRKQFLFLLSFLLILHFLVIFTACSTTETLVQWITPAPYSLKKRVMVLPFIDQAGLGPERTTQLTAELGEHLGESSRLLLYDPPKGESWPIDEKSLELGIVTHPKLIQSAHELGINALVTGVIHPIEISDKETGLWPFRETCRVYGISVIVNVVDVHSGALLFTQLGSEDVSLPLEDAQGLNEKDLPEQFWMRVLARILKQQALTVIEKLSHGPWFGRILAVDNGTIRINAGRDVGLQPGHRLEAFSWGESFPSLSGRPFDILGEKTGEIVVESIMEKAALAVPDTGGPFLAGQVIKLKH